MQILSFRSLESVWDLDMGVWNFSAVLPRFSSLCPWSSALIDSISLLTVQGKSRRFLRVRDNVGDPYDHGAEKGARDHRAGFTVDT